MIIYTVICRVRDISVLVEVSSPDLSGNAPQVTTKLLTHLRDNPDQVVEGEFKTFVQRNGEEDNMFSYFLESCTSALTEEWAEDYFFHILMKEGVFYCCIGDDSDLRDQKVNFAFLEQVANEFTGRFRKGRINTANAYALDRDFSPTVRSAMHYHNINHTSIAREERVAKMMAKIDNMRRLMGANIHLMLERGEKLEKMIEQSDALEEDAAIFKRRSTSFRQRQQRRYWVKKMILIGMIVFGLCLFVYVTTIAICGAQLQFCRDEDRKGAGGGDRVLWIEMSADNVVSD